MSRTLSVALASAASFALITTPAALAAPDILDPASAAAEYLAEQVPEDGDLGGAGGTADAVLALVAAGGHQEEVDTMLGFLEEQAADYASVSGPAAAKLAVVAAATNGDATAFGPDQVDLIATIQDSIVTSGDDEGACDAGFPSAFGNAWCILALTRNGAEVPPELLSNSYTFQNQKTGAFGYDGPEGYTADADSTSLMLNALAGVVATGGDSEEEAELLRTATLSAAAARDYLVSAQTEEGYWESYSEINSTGLAAPALDTVGVDQELAVEWLTGQQNDDGSLPNVIDGDTGNLMATTQGMLPFTGESYLSVGHEGWDSVELVVNPEEVARIGGENRYETAAAASRANFEPGVETVYVATGQEYADALTGSALAGHQEVPVLLVQPEHLPTATAAELTRLEPQSISVLGGESAVSEQIEDELETFTDGDVLRLGGENRYETAAAVAAEFPEGDHVYIATGATYADALAASAAAGADGEPVLLVQKENLPGATAAQLEELDPRLVTVLGGEDAVSSETLKEIYGYANAVVRVAGENRYETAAKLSAKRGEPVGAVLATGTDYPDALTGAAAAAMADVPVLLVQPEHLPSATVDELSRYNARLLAVMGGTSAISEDVVEALKALNYAG